MIKFDYVLVGGGLQSGLLALALQHLQPNSRVLLLEAASRFGGNHTWSFHTSDLPNELLAAVEPLGLLDRITSPEVAITGGPR